MSATIDDLLIFWMTPWSKPLRDTCVWLARFGAPISGKRPDRFAPTWVRPLFMQRWVARAIATRLAWIAAHPDLPADQYEDESEPQLNVAGWTAYERCWLRTRPEERLLHTFGVEVERLLRIMQEPPTLVGDDDWTHAALEACEHLAQVYHELRRRHKATRARAIVRDALRRFSEGQRGGEAA